VHRRPQIRSLGEFLTDLLSQAVYVSKTRNFFRNAFAWGTGMMAALRLLPAESEPVIFGVHGAVAEHYRVSPTIAEPRATTLDYIVAAAAG
jgi:hypothetical protein